MTAVTRPIMHRTTAVVGRGALVQLMNPCRIRLSSKDNMFMYTTKRLIQHDAFKASSTH